MSECKHGVRMTCFCPSCAASSPDPTPQPADGAQQARSDDLVRDCQELCAGWPHSHPFRQHIELCLSRITADAERIADSNAAHAQDARTITILEAEVARLTQERRELLATNVQLSPEWIERLSK